MYALYLLAEFREKKAFSIIIDILHGDREMVDFCGTYLVHTSKNLYEWREFYESFRQKEKATRVNVCSFPVCVSADTEIAL